MYASGVFLVSSIRVLGPGYAQCNRTSLWGVCGVSPCKLFIFLLQAKARKDKEAGVKKTKKVDKKGQRAKGKAFYKGLTSDSDYVGEDYEVFSSWLGQSQ